MPANGPLIFSVLILSILTENILTMESRVLGVFVCLLHLNTAMRIIMKRRNITSVPRDINKLVTELNLDENGIVRITKLSFVHYREIRILKISKNGLTYIEDGSFDNNGNLERLIANYNSISHLPQSFGLAAKRLRYIEFWHSLDKDVTARFNVKQLVALTHLNIGRANHHGKFDTATLPDSLEYIGLNFAQLFHFPDFSNHTPVINKIAVASNKIQLIPQKAFVNNLQLQTLWLMGNRLQSVPDLYHLPLTSLDLSNNPLKCNRSLCWIRMWPWMKMPLKRGGAICRSPEFLDGFQLMDINPVTLGCYHGRLNLYQFTILITFCMLHANMCSGNLHRI